MNKWHKSFPKTPPTVHSEIAWRDKKYGDRVKYIDNYKYPLSISILYVEKVKCSYLLAQISFAIFLVPPETYFWD